MAACRLASVCAFLAIASATSHVIADTFGSGDNEFEIDFVTIGNPGNPSRPPRGAFFINPTGTVDYVYRIGKYEVSREMIERANAEGGLRLTMADMEFVTGILGDGPRPAMPATGISWNEAARFINWLNISQGFSPAYKFSTQPGEGGYAANANIELWEDGDPGFDAANPFRNSQSQYFLPSADEWYKAAYYDPNANGGAGGYWDYATGPELLGSVASGTDSGTAVYSEPSQQGPADITKAGGLSPFGTMAQSGNVWELEETNYDLTNDDILSGSHSPWSGRGHRGGDWSVSLSEFFQDGGLHAIDRVGVAPEAERYNLGFRVASIPEPSSLWLAALGMTGLMLRKRRLR